MKVTCFTSHHKGRNPIILMLTICVSTCPKTHFRSKDVLFTDSHINGRLEYHQRANHKLL